MITQHWSLQHYFSNALNRAIHVEFELTNDDEHEFGCRQDSELDDLCFYNSLGKRWRKEREISSCGALWAQSLDFRGENPKSDFHWLYLGNIESLFISLLKALHGV